MVLESESDDSAIDDSKLGKLNYFEFKKKILQFSGFTFLMKCRQLYLNSRFSFYKLLSLSACKSSLVKFYS